MNFVKWFFSSSYNKWERGIEVMQDVAEKMIIVSVKSRDISVFDIKSNLFKVC